MLFARLVSAANLGDKMDLPFFHKDGVVVFVKMSMTLSVIDNMLVVRIDAWRLYQNYSLLRKFATRFENDDCFVFQSPTKSKLVQHIIIIIL